MNEAIYPNNFQVLCCCNRKNKSIIASKANNEKYPLRDTPRYVVGIIYEELHGELGFYDFWDEDLNRIINKAFYIIKNGRSSYPSIPQTADPRILYLYDNVKKRNLGDLFKKNDDQNA